MNPVIKYQLLGAQILGLDPDPVFYRSPMASLTAGGLRGGQQIIFPQFADRGPYKKHGIARDLLWEIITEERAPYMQRVIMSREFSSKELAGWPHHAIITLYAKYTLGRIQHTFEVQNLGAETLFCSGGLHPYLAVTDLQKATVRGLSGIPYQDRYKPGPNLLGPEILRWGKAPCEKLFDDVPDLELDAGQYKMRLDASGFDQWMIWNPGREGAKALADLPDEDWNRFICIEPVCVSSPVMLSPGSKFSGRFNIELISIN